MGHPAQKIIDLIDNTDVNSQESLVHFLKTLNAFHESTSEGLYFAQGNLMRVYNGKQLQEQLVLGSEETNALVIGMINHYLSTLSDPDKWVKKLEQIAQKANQLMANNEELEGIEENGQESHRLALYAYAFTTARDQFKYKLPFNDEKNADMVRFAQELENEDFLLAVTNMEGKLDAEKIEILKKTDSYHKIKMHVPEATKEVMEKFVATLGMCIEQAKVEGTKLSNESPDTDENSKKNAIRAFENFCDKCQLIKLIIKKQLKKMPVEEKYENREAYHRALDAWRKETEEKYQKLAERTWDHLLELEDYPTIKKIQRNSPDWFGKDLAKDIKENHINLQNLLAVSFPSKKPAFLTITSLSDLKHLQKKETEGSLVKPAIKLFKDVDYSDDKQLVSFTEKLFNFDQSLKANLPSWQDDNVMRLHLMLNHLSNLEQNELELIYRQIETVRKNLVQKNIVIPEEWQNTFDAYIEVFVKASELNFQMPVNQTAHEEFEQYYKKIRPIEQVADKMMLQMEHYGTLLDNCATQAEDEKQSLIDKLNKKRRGALVPSLNKDKVKALENSFGKFINDVYSKSDKINYLMKNKPMASNYQTMSEYQKALEIYCVKLKSTFDKSGKSLLESVKTLEENEMVAKTRHDTKGNLTKILHFGIEKIQSALNMIAPKFFSPKSDLVKSRTEQSVQKTVRTNRKYK